MEMLVLILAIAMVVPFPLEEIVGGYVRLLLVPIGFILIIRWIIKNDQKKDRSPQQWRLRIATPASIAGDGSQPRRCAGRSRGYRWRPGPGRGATFELRPLSPRR